jgi:hypothetical protein
MLVLFDNGTPRTLARYLIGQHTVTEARARGWEQLGNSELLTAAEAAGFEVLVTTDRNLRYQQNLASRKIALVVLGQGRWSIIKRHITEVVAGINAARPGSYTEIDMPLDNLLARSLSAALRGMRSPALHIGVLCATPLKRATPGKTLSRFTLFPVVCLIMRPSEALTIHRAELWQIVSRYDLSHTRIFGSVLSVPTRMRATLTCWLTPPKPRLYSRPLGWSMKRKNY